MKQTALSFRFSLTHPHRALGAALIIAFTSTIIFLLTLDRGIYHHLSKAPLRLQLGLDKVLPERMMYDTLLVTIQGGSKTNQIFTPEGLALTASLGKGAGILAVTEKNSKGIIASDYLAPGNVDVVTSTELGSVGFSPLMPTPPKDIDHAEQIAERGLSSTLLNNILFAPDKSAIALHLPLVEGGQTVSVKKQLLAAIPPDQVKTDHTIRFGGQPYARELFFSKVTKSGLLLFTGAALLVSGILFLVTGSIAGALIPVTTAVCTTSFITALQTLLTLPADILSFCIPILSASTSVLYSLFLISAYTKLFGTGTGIGRKECLQEAVAETEPQLRLLSCTLAAGALCLAFSPLPPVRFFGLFTATALISSWLFTLFVVPALIMLLAPEKTIPRKITFPLPPLPIQIGFSLSPSSVTDRLTKLSRKMPKHFLLGHATLLFCSLTAIFFTDISDNPVDWFDKHHPVRVADKTINRHFAGSYHLELNLLLDQAKPLTVDDAAVWLKQQLRRPMAASLPTREIAYTDIDANSATSENSIQLAESLATLWQERIRMLPVEDALLFDLWSQALDTLSQLLHQHQIFLHPDMMRYISRLQQHLTNRNKAPKVLSVADIVKTMHQALFENNPERRSIPETASGVAQTLKAFRKQRHPIYLDHFINRDATRCTFHIYVRNSNPELIDSLAETVADFLKKSPPPAALSTIWSGAAIENRVWQQKVTSAMVLWGGAAILISFALFALLTKSPLTAGICSALSLYSITLLYGLCAFLGINLKTLNTSFILLTLILTQSLVWMTMVRVKSYIRETGSMPPIETKKSNVTIYDTIILKSWLSACLAASIIFLFSGYDLLQTQSVLIIILATVNWLIIVTFLPPILGAAENHLFSSDFNYFARIISASEKDKASEQLQEDFYQEEQEDLADESENNISVAEASDTKFEKLFQPIDQDSNKRKQKSSDIESGQD